MVLSLLFGVIDSGLLSYSIFVADTAGTVWWSNFASHDIFCLSDGVCVFDYDENVWVDGELKLVVCTL